MPRDDLFGYEHPGGWSDRERFQRHTSGRVPSLRNLAEDALHGPGPAPKIKPAVGGKETPVTKVRGVSKMPASSSSKTTKKAGPAPRHTARVVQVTLDKLMDTTDPMQTRTLTTIAKQQGTLP